MNWRHASRWFGASGALLALLAWQLLALTAESVPPAEPELQPVFASSTPAKQSPQLVLVDDGRQVVGWLAGMRPAQGETVAITVGDRQHHAGIRADNTFAWPYAVENPTQAIFRLGEQSGTLHLRPRQATPPAVLFIVDRPVYRPGQTLRFIGFLRREDADGQLAPLPNEKVQVQLVSRGKQSIATRLDLTSDAQGRIESHYEFSSADPLDAYELKIKDFRGSAEVRLAEFRKAKVRLAIESERQGEELALTFRALDFLNKPVAGSQVQLHAQVVLDGSQSDQGPLDATQYAYHDASLGLLPDRDEVSEEDWLLWRAGEGGLTGTISQQTVVLSQLNAQVEMGADGVAEYRVPIEQHWNQANHRLLVSAVMVDYNGHEQRSTRSFPLAAAQPNDKPRLALRLSHTYPATGEPLRVAASLLNGAADAAPLSGTLVVMRLKPRQPIYGGHYGYYGHYGQRSHLFHLNQGAVPLHWLLQTRGDLVRNGRQPRYSQWQQHQAGSQQPEREMVTATLLRDGVANLQIDEPGAYKLVCVAELPGGTKLEQELGCVVKRPEELPGLKLQLDRQQLDAGQLLTARLHSRFADAPVMLTLRDSLGIRWWKILPLRGTSAKVEIRLPERLAYECRLESQLAGDGERAHIASEPFRVIPSDRLLDITADLPVEATPGEEVELKLSVNRRQRTDLVVSVYDHSLLGVASDTTVDARNFLLADDRVRRAAAYDLLRRSAGGRTVRELIDLAADLLEKQPELAHGPFGDELQAAVSNYRGSRLLYAQHVPVLLRGVGVECRYLPWQHFGGHNWYHRFDREQEADHPALLVEILEQERDGWRLEFQRRGDVLTMAEHHESHGELVLQQVLQLQSAQLSRSGFGMARGDARHSYSGNAMHSNVSGQALMSYAAPTPTPALLTADAGDVVVRRDFSDAAYWNGAVSTDDRGKATIRFKLPDSLTNWRVVVTAVTPDLAVGHLAASFRTNKPIMVWPIVPRTFTEGDQVRLYGSVHNRTDRPQPIDVSLKVDNGEVVGPAKVRVTIPAGEQRPVWWTFRPGETGFTQLLMTARCEAGSDASLKRLPVTRLASEQLVTTAGFCRDTATLNIPEGVYLDDAQLQLTITPTLADDLVESLDYLVEYPYGCVEQTMSRFLPAIRVAQTLQRAKISRPELEERLPSVVSAGVKRLLELQNSDGGWGWHNGSQTHEMMTPYALFGLLEAEQAGYELPREQGLESGLNRLQAFIEQMGERQAADRIFCMYVYSRRRPAEDYWWTFINTQADQNKLSDYALAMSLELAVRHERPQLADKLAALLRKRAVRENEAAWWTTAGFSRWGDDRYEITAAVLKALVAHDAEDELIAPVVRFFVTTKHGNRWNSTKATAAAIYALCDYVATQEVELDQQQTLVVQVNDLPPQALVIDRGKSATLTLPAERLRHGETTIRFVNRVPGAMYRAVFRHWQQGERIEPLDRGIQVTRKFHLLDQRGSMVRELKSGDHVPRGSYLRCEVLSQRRQSLPLNYSLVECPKPSCGEIVPADDNRFSARSSSHALREDRTWGVAWHHEASGDRLENRAIFRAELPGVYQVPPARVEMMYDSTTLGHSDAFTLHVDEQESPAGS